MKRFIFAFIGMFLLAHQLLALPFANATFSSKHGEIFHLYLNGRLINPVAANYVRLDHVAPGNHRIEVRVNRPRAQARVRTRVFLDAGFENNFVLRGPARNGAFAIDKINAVPLAPAYPPAPVPPVPAPLPDNYYQYNPGNSYSSQCPNLFTGTQTENLIQSLANKNFESDKLTIAKQAVSHGSLLAEDVRRIMSVFGFESSRIEFAKFAYSYTCDRQNYYVVNDAFEYSASISELDRFLKQR